MRSRLLRTLAALTACALIVSACGDDDEGSATDEGSTEGSQPGSADGAPEVDSVIFSGVTPNAGNWAIQAGVAEGIFEEYGLPTEMIFSSSSPAALAALLSGSVHFTSTVYDSGIQAYLQNEDVIYVAGGYDTFVHELVVSPDVQSIDDLEGKTCGATNPPGVGDHLYTQLMLSGLSDGELKINENYEIINVSSQVPSLAAAFESGQISCFVILPPGSSLLNDLGYPTLAIASDVSEFDGYPFFGINTLRSWAEDNPNATQAFLQGYLASVAWLYDPANRERAVEILAENAGLEPEIADAAYAWVEGGGYPRTGVVDEDWIRRIIEVQQQFGSLTALVDDIAPEIVDNSYVEDAYEGLPDEVKSEG